MSARYRKAHPCPTATKRAWPDRISADLALATILNDPGPPREKMPVRSYLCPCGRWHLTSLPIAYAEPASADAVA